MESYLVALGAWLVLPLRLRRGRLLDVSPQDWGWPGLWVAMVLATTLVHCWGRPLDMTADLQGSCWGGGVLSTTHQFARSCWAPPPYASPR